MAMPIRESELQRTLAPDQAEPQVRVLVPIQHGEFSIHEINYGGKSLWRELGETILVTLLIFLMVQAVVQNRRVEGQSMEPTLRHEEYLLIDKLSYLRWDNTIFAALFPPTDGNRPRYLLGAGPQRGDIIVLHPPADPDTRDYIKRIIALEGETVEIKAGDGVYINGVRLDEPYIKEIPDYTEPPYTVPAGHVFVLGDNRNNSSDSHIWAQPGLRIDQIVGKAWIAYWPRELWGIIPHPSYAEIDQNRP
jgi:signal peptidase I